MRAKVGGIIACRMDSRRLPGKVLRLVQGHPLLWYVLTRCRATPELADAIVVATTDRAIDDRIVAFCHDNNVRVHRGCTDDVAGRLLAAAEDHGFDWFFRLNGDSPFVEPALLSEAWRIVAASESRYDLVTNLQPRSFPYGVSVELLRTGALATAYHEMSEPAHFEHVTLFLYRNLARFRYYNMLRLGGDASSVRLTVDTQEDLARFERALGVLGERWAPGSYVDALSLYG